MTKNKSRIREWVESRITGVLTMPQWHKLRGKYSNQQLKAMSRERIRQDITVSYYFHEVRDI